MAMPCRDTFSLPSASDTLALSSAQGRGSPHSPVGTGSHQAAGPGRALTRPTGAGPSVRNTSGQESVAGRLSPPPDRSLAQDRTLAQLLATGQTAGSRGGLAGLTGDSLHQTLTRARRLALQPARLPGWQAMESVSSACFSPCGRWLAISSSPGPGAAGGEGLRLYGWQDNHWQAAPQSSAPYRPAGPVGTLAFAPKGSDPLFASYGADLVVWNRSAHSDHWSCQRLYTLASPWRSGAIHPMVSGDLVVFCDKGSGACGYQLLFFCARADSRGWDAPVLQTDSRTPVDFVCKAAAGLVALGLVEPQSHPGLYSSSVHIWRTRQETAGARISRQLCPLAPSRSRLTRLAFSPDNEHLLGSMDNRQLILWHMDPAHGLEEKLRTVCGELQVGTRLADQVAFRDDGQRLAVPEGAGRIQLWNREGRGQWRRAGKVQLVPDPAMRPVSRVLLSDEGRTLVCLSRHQVAVWCKGGGQQGWRQELLRSNSSPTAWPTGAWLLGAGAVIATQAQDPSLALWLHGQGPEGRLVRKACQPLAQPIICASPDGMIWLTGLIHRPAPLSLQLTLPCEAVVPQEPDSQPGCQTRTGPAPS